MSRAMLSVVALIVLSCHSGGNAWLNEPLPSGKNWGEPSDVAPPSNDEPERPQHYDLEGRVITESSPHDDLEGEATRGGKRTIARRKIEGKLLGKFRNTYYDFPSEADYEGSRVSLKNPACDTIKKVPRSFFEEVCVQGSGTLSDGATVSFAKRDCDCAEVCPRTNQRICFDRLDPSRFPWGRGATGGPITPLLTVAVDSDVIPLGTAIYVPEMDGLPSDVRRTSFHDGCFIAQDRGLKVKGKQVDFFTGHQSMTKLWNRLVPSNEGVRVVLDNPRCARARKSSAP